MKSTSEVVTEPAHSGPGSRARFVIDARRSRFTVQAFAAGILSVAGHNPTIAIRTFSGEVEFDPKTPQACGLNLVIQAASLSVQDDVSDKDRREIERIMNGEVLEVEKYPEIRYEASAIAVTRLGDAMFSALLNGDLRFHGLTRTQALTARVMTMGEMLRASGEFTLKQSDYQVKPVSVAGGALKVKDEVKFSFDIVAQSQQTAT